MGGSEGVIDVVLHKRWCELFKGGLHAYTALINMCIGSYIWANIRQCASHVEMSPPLKGKWRNVN